MEKEANHLFWTGGWDSTFRLLDLLLLKQRPVRPYYVINLKRPSFHEEIRTMSAIKGMIFERAPETEELLMPLEIRERSDIKPNDVITERFERLSAVMVMGQQYEYLARFADELGLFDLELSVRSRVHKFLEPALIHEADGNDSYYRLRDEMMDTDMGLFKYFRFPILHLDKLGIQELTVKHGFEDIMEHTWFCYMPAKGRVPCGGCNPCLQVIKAGMGRRIPLINRVRGSIRRRRLLTDIKSLASKYSLPPHGAG